MDCSIKPFGKQLRALCLGANPTLVTLTHGSSEPKLAAVQFTCTPTSFRTQSTYIALFQHTAYHLEWLPPAKSWSRLFFWSQGRNAHNRMNRTKITLEGRYFTWTRILPQWLLKWTHLRCLRDGHTQTQSRILKDAIKITIPQGRISQSDRSYILGWRLEYYSRFQLPILSFWYLRRSKNAESNLSSQVTEDFGAMLPSELPLITPYMPS
jgi:hypothetical protein